VLGPWAHWYVAGGARYVVALWAIAVLLGILFTSAYVGWAIVVSASALLMWYRFQRVQPSGPTLTAG
jgi:hypothetical protein